MSKPMDNIFTAFQEMKKTIPQDNLVKLVDSIERKLEASKDNAADNFELLNSVADEMDEIYDRMPNYQQAWPEAKEFVQIFIPFLEKLEITNTALNLFNQGNFCAYCHQITDNLKSCSKCRKIKYCSKQCQKADWKSHKLNCM